MEDMISMCFPTGEDAAQWIDGFESISSLQVSALGEFTYDLCYSLPKCFDTIAQFFGMSMPLIGLSVRQVKINDCPSPGQVTLIAVTSMQGTAKTLFIERVTLTPSSNPDQCRMEEVIKHDEGCLPSWNLEWMLSIAGKKKRDNNITHFRMAKDVKCSLANLSQSGPGLCQQ
jgi:hypothetical protein